MNKKEVGFDSSSFLKSLGSSLDLVKVITENTDNAIQHGGESVIVIVNEQDATITVYEQGPGFTPTSWDNYHTIAGCPVNTLGCSKYNIGSKTFHHFADFRTVHSVGADNKVYRSMWKSGESFVTFDDSIDELTNIKNKLNLDSVMGTAVVLGGVNFESYKTASSFASKLHKVCQERYSYKLYKTNKSLGILYINNKGNQEEIKLVEARNYEKRIVKETLATSTIDGIVIRSFLDSNEARYVGDQGIDVFYDDIMIDKLGWFHYSSKKGLQTKAPHFTLNNARQYVFLTPQNSEGVNIDLHKTNCSLPVSVQKRLASDLNTLSSKLSNQRVVQTSKNPIPAKQKTVNEFVVKSREEFFNRPDNMDLPFARDSKNGKIYMNSDSAFYDKFVDKNAKERSDWVKLFDAMFEIYDNRGKEQKEMNFIKEVLQHFDSKI